MKRSNRLVLLVGVFLAIVAFVGILVLVRSPAASPTAPPPPTTGPVVVATVDIPLSTRIRADQVTTHDDRPGRHHARRLQGSVAGHRPDRPPAGRQGRPDHGRHSSALRPAVRSPPSTARRPCAAWRVQVDQISGVGTVIKTGDYVDMVVGLTADAFPVTTVSPADNTVTVVTGLNGTSVKLLLQGMQVMGTLAPAAGRARRAAPASPAPSAPTGGPGHDPDRPAADRHPGGHRPAGRSPEVRPDGRQRHPGPSLARRLRRPGHGSAAPAPRRRSRPASPSRSSSTRTASCRPRSSRPCTPAATNNP